MVKHQTSVKMLNEFYRDGMCTLKMLTQTKIGDKGQKFAPL